MTALFKRGEKVEGPERIAAFLAGTKSLDWSRPNVEASLDVVFVALDQLVQAEIRYYYGKRKRRRNMSIVLRGLAWLTGSLGLLAPLLAGALGGENSVDRWGYVLLAIAASFIAANSLFSGTSGHIRYVTAQLGLERLIISFRIEWYQTKSLWPDEQTDETIKSGFGLMLGFAKDAHGTMSEETKAWGTALEQALANFEAATKSPKV
jgi:hypothetical protein